MLLELPLTRPPPWMNTKTGRRAPAGRPLGRRMLRNRQFSFPVSAPLPPRTGQLLPYRVASRTPGQAAAGWGGAQRRVPTGGAAYGMPKKLSMPPPVVPRTAPRSVVTTGRVTAAAALSAGSASPALAARSGAASSGAASAVSDRRPARGNHLMTSPEILDTRSAPAIELPATTRGFMPDCPVRPGLSTRTPARSAHGAQLQHPPGRVGNAVHVPDAAYGNGFPGGHEATRRSKKADLRSS